MHEKTLIITDSLVRKHLDADEVIRRVEETWRWYGEGKIIMPSKVTTDMAPAGIAGWFNSMPSYVGPPDMAGIKVVGGYADNPRRGLPFIRANLLLTDPRTGFLRAVMAGDWISDMRTGAQPAVAARHLAARTGVVTFIGAGLQATTSLQCMSRLLPLEEVRVCDLKSEARSRFIARFAGSSFRLVDCADREAACRGADVIVTVTTADEPLVEEPWVKKGALVMTMGSYTETSDDVCLRADRLMADHLGQAMHRGNFKSLVDRGALSAASFAAEMTEVVAGRKPGRGHADERIVLALVGMGCLDLSVASLAYERIVASGEQVPAVDLGS